MQKAAVRGRGVLADSWSVTDTSHPLKRFTDVWGSTRELWRRPGSCILGLWSQRVLGDHSGFTGGETEVQRSVPGPLSLPPGLVARATQTQCPRVSAS